MKRNNLRSQQAFTIVELLVVIVVIAILAAISFVAYSGISQRATAALVQSDLANSSKLLKLYQAEYGYFPTLDPVTYCPISPSIVDTKYCLKPSTGVSYQYIPLNGSNPQSFTLTANKPSASTTYRITSSTSPTLVSNITCPTGFIIVPGSPTYSTNDFCVMKYEAKNVAGVATSQAAGTPWVSISQTSAITTAAAACTGCKLITEAEWMTIAQNVLSVASNWSGGVVGSGYVFSGHNDGIPAAIQAATTDDLDGYYFTGQANPSSQRRTLKLNNGETIWDIAGNICEWTAGQITGGQPGANGSGLLTREYNSITNLGTLPVNVFPSGTGIQNSSTWVGNNGIGQMASNPDESTQRGFTRSGDYGDGASYAGILVLKMSYAPGYVSAAQGFRVTK